VWRSRAGVPGTFRHEEAITMTERDDPTLRTGAEQTWDPEDLAEAKGQDPTPDNVARAAHELDEEGPEAIEKTVP
jgi:hypothetical protein